jgi:hypothetical protein
MADERKSFTIEGAQIIFRNFAGNETQFNTRGDRNFAVILDPDLAEQMAKDGWNVRYLKVREEDEGAEPTPYIPVKVNFKNRPPRIVMLTDNSRTQLNESNVEVLDYADIKNVDIIATGYDWVVGPNSGTKAYLQTMFVTIEEDYLERKYGIHEDPPQQS